MNLTEKKLGGNRPLIKEIKTTVSRKNKHKKCEKLWFLKGNLWILKNN